MEKSFDSVKSFVEKKYFTKVDYAPEKVVKDYEVYNKSYIVGDDKIYVGKFDDEDLIICSIFHEVGHMLITDKKILELEFNRVDIEKECWKIGIKEANKNGINFSFKEYRFMVKSFNSYK